MTPRFAQAVDPVFLHVLDVHDRVSRGDRVTAREEHLRINALLDQAGALIGAGPDWELAKYAIVSWIDELLVDTPWDGRDWWSNNVLEVEHFNTRLCYEHFYLRAQEASTLPQRDALEVFYICVVLGFRGLYRDPLSAEGLIQSHGLPADIQTWSRQVSLAIRLGQGRPALRGPQKEIAGAPPLKSRTGVVWTVLATSVLALANILVLYYTVLSNPG